MVFVRSHIQSIFKYLDGKIRGEVSKPTFVPASVIVHVFSAKDVLETKIL